MKTYGESGRHLRVFPWCLMLFLYLKAMVSANVTSATGKIELDVNDDQAPEITLNSTGLGIGTNPSATLHVAGNAMTSESLTIGSASPGSANLNINGSFGMTFQSVSSNVTLGPHSVVLADSSSGNITLTLPDASDFPGRKYRVKKVSESHRMTLSGGNFTIDQWRQWFLSSGNYGYISVLSHNSQWYVLNNSSDAMPVIERNAALAWVSSSTLPSGWSYLESDSANGGTEVALLTDQSIGSAGATGFGSGGTFGTSIVLGDNTDGNEYEIFNDGQLNGALVGTDLLLHPSNSTNSYSIVRYTISSYDLLNGNSGTISGNFRNLISGGDSVECSVYHNTIQVFNVVPTGGTLSQTDGTFNISRTLSLGDKIDFVVSRRTSYYGDETALQATISIGN